MLRLIAAMAILAALIYFVMGGGGKKTIKDYKNFSREELETLCLEKNDKIACQHITVDYIKENKPKK